VKERFPKPLMSEDCDDDEFQAWVDATYFVLDHRDIFTPEYVLYHEWLLDYYTDLLAKRKRGSI
jgi:hypothetical protein